MTFHEPQDGVAGGLTADDVNQFLSTHPFYARYAGAAIVDTMQQGGVSDATTLGTDFYKLAFDTPQPAGNIIKIAQPFTGVTDLGRVEFVVKTTGVGADVSIEIQTDAAGAPSGIVVASHRVPRDVLTAYQRDEILLGEWQPTTQIGDPSVTAPGIAVSNGFGVLVGGYDPPLAAYLDQVIIATLSPLNEADGSGIADDWYFGPPYPVAAQGIATAGAGNYIVAVGGDTGAAFLNTVNVAPIDGFGRLGGWNAQPVYPEAVRFAGMVANGATVYVIGGNLTTGSPWTSSAAVRRATLNDSGQISSWLDCVPLPVPLFDMQCVIINGYLVVIGGNTLSPPGNTSANVWASLINGDGSLAGWLPWASLAKEGGSAWVVGDNILTAWGGQDDDDYTVWTLHVSPTGVPDAAWRPLGNAFTPPFVVGGPGAISHMPSPWQTVTDPAWVIIPAHYSGNSGTDVAVLGAAANLVTRYSIPFDVTLTPGNTYWLVINGGGDATDFNSVPIMRKESDGSDFAQWAATFVTGGAWTVTAFARIPVTLYDATVTGRLTHTVADAGARVAWIVYDGHARPTDVIEYLDRTVSVRHCSYADGVLTQVI